jgi:NAD/NADP transhydrogenase beta subunit
MLAADFTLTDARDLVYLLALAGFILALKGLGSPKYARRGNQLGAVAALAAVAMTFTLPRTWCWRSSPWCWALSSPSRWPGW